MPAGRMLLGVQANRFIHNGAIADGTMMMMTPSPIGPLGGVAIEIENKPGFSIHTLLSPPPTRALT